MKVIDPMVSGLMDPEGPVALDDGRWLVVEMHPDRGCVTMIDPTSHSLSLIKRTGRPNGLALAANGDVLVAESSKPALLRLTMDGESRTLLTHDDRGEPFLFPNDLCFGPDGRCT